MPECVTRENISIILHRPRFPENIGAAARAMCNMGFDQLIVVEPENFDLKRVLTMATHAAADIVEKMTVSKDLKTALSSYHYVVGTTARLGRQRQVINSPAKLAELIVTFDAFGHDRQSQAVPELDDGPDDVVHGRVPGEIGDKRLVDLQDVDGEARQISQR